MRRVALLGLAALAAAAIPTRPAAAVQGLLHKHQRGVAPALGAMRPLPAQAALGDVASPDGATAAVVTAVPGSTSVPGAVGASPGMPPIRFCPVSPPVDGVPTDAVPMPLPTIDGGLPIACPVDPAVGSDLGSGGTVSIGGWPDMFGPPAFGPPLGDKADGRFVGPLPGAAHPGHGPRMFGLAHGPSSSANPLAMSASGFGQATAAAATTPPPGRNVAAGLPGRAVGIRPGPLDLPGRSPAPTIASATPGSSGGVPRDAGVIQAGGMGQARDGSQTGAAIPAGGMGQATDPPPHRAAAARTAATPTAPVSGVPAAGAAAPPRWRDRLRVVWPTAN